MTKDRDFKKEYEEYHSKPEQLKRRAARNRDRREANRKYTKEELKGKDVHHCDDKNMKKPVLRDMSKNRGDKR